MDVTTITLNKDMKKKLDKLKVHPRESYNDVLSRLLSKSPHNTESIVDNDSLYETIEILSNPKIMKSLAKSLEDLKKGKTYSIEEV